MMSRVMEAAIAVAASPPAKRGQYVTGAKVYWPLIEELRAALDERGIEWRPGPWPSPAEAHRLAQARSEAHRNHHGA